MASNIVLVGLSGSGKSTVARCLASRLGWSTVDTDAMIEAEMGATITDIFASQGEAAFRRLESETVIKAMSGTHQVIATGGGAILLERNREQLWGRGFVVYLQTSPETLADRLSVHGASDRPLLKGDLRRRLASLLEARSHYYEQAHAVISTNGASPDAIAERIANAYEHSI